MVFEDVMGGAQHYHISKVVAQSKEPEVMIRRGDKISQRQQNQMHQYLTTEPLDERLVFEKTPEELRI